MTRPQRVILLIGILGTVLVVLPAAGCWRAAHFNRHLNSIVKPYRFRILRWELRQVLDLAEAPRDGAGFRVGRRDETESVLAYFSLVDEIGALEREMGATGNGQDALAGREEELERLQERKKAVRGAVERVIGCQIRQSLSEQGIFNPADRYVSLKIGFPPISFRLGQPPNLLVVSPRDRIKSVRKVILVQDISLAAVEDIEARVDALGVSALVVELGGFGGTYPAFVADTGSLQFTVEAATEEWLHQYLAFTPLGFLYLLDVIGVYRSYDIVTMNETLAGMVSEEIADTMLEAHYPRYASEEKGEESSHAECDFCREMREIRTAVDQFLANGEVERAEEYMEERRQYLAAKGHHIRKLNQAYFAFHGAYADEPTSVSPIGAEMREARRQSASLAEFLSTVASMTSHQDLVDSLKANPP